MPSLYLKRKNTIPFFLYKWKNEELFFSSSLEAEKENEIKLGKIHQHFPTCMTFP